MKAFAVFLVTLLTSACSVHAQPDSLWSRTFGGQYRDQCRSVLQTSDGGYVLAGYTYSFGAGYSDMWFLKTNANGDSVWSRTFGGQGWDDCSSVLQTSDGGYVLAGGTDSFGAADFNMWLLKTDANGDSLWSRTFGGTMDDRAYSVQATSDGGYVLAGYTASNGAGSDDMWLVKTDANGDSLWSRTFGGLEDDEVYSVQATADGGCVLAGLTFSFGSGRSDMWLLKTDAEGDSLWSHTFGGIGDDIAYSVLATSDGGYVLAGLTTSFGSGRTDMWLLKTDAEGDSLWSHTFGGTGYDRAHSVQATADGGYVLAGYTTSNGAGYCDIWLLRTDAEGDSLWSRTFGGVSDDIAYSVQTTIDSGYVLAGLTWSFDADSTYDMWLLKTGPDPVNAVAPSFTPQPSSFSLSSYPNPFNPSTTLSFSLPQSGKATLSLFDITGRCVRTLLDQPVSRGEHQYCLDGNGLATGVYFLRLQTPLTSATQKVVLLK